MIGTNMLTLYNAGTSVCSVKARVGLAEKGLEWEGVYIDILKGEQFDPEYQKLNPKSEEQSQKLRKLGKIILIIGGVLG